MPQIRKLTQNRAAYHPPLIARRTCRRRFPALFSGLLLILPSATQSQIFISPTGSDTNTGTIEQPFLSLPKAHSVVQPGDTIYARGGTYTVSATMTLSKSGTSVARYHLRGYQQERPLFDCSSMATSGSNRGLRVSGGYWHIYGIDLKGAGDNGLNMSGSNNIVEWSTFFENRDSGVQLDNGAANNHFINCDSYYNSDPTSENADGFAPKLTVGSGNRFTACRSWQNADDGWDGYLRGTDTVQTLLEYCWSFNNGYLKDGTPSLPNGDGNGFKMGGSDNKDLHHNMALVRCLAFDNRVKGFDQNNNRGSMTIINGTAYRNGSNYSLPGPVDSGYAMTITNSIVYGGIGNISAAVNQTTNSWLPPFSTDASDFQSVDTTGTRGPRGPDGSLPNLTFLRLASGSDLINGGTDAGYPYDGPAPDLGAFERVTPVGVGPSLPVPSSFSISQNFPNPFNPATTLRYEIPKPGFVTIRIVDLLGQVLASEERRHVSRGVYEYRWYAFSNNGIFIPSGAYFAVITFERESRTMKLLLLR